MNKLYKRTISDDTTLIIQDGGMVEIWNDLEDGSRSGVGVKYAELGALIAELRAARDYIHDKVLRDCVAVQYLLLSAGQMATKDLVEDVVLARWEVDRGMVHTCLNMLTEHGQSAYRRVNGDGSGWVWTQPDQAAPTTDEYPEIELVRRRAAARKN